jgi:serine/threonine protein kinase/tetratricopeptide (TPR) repeat protein
MGPLNDPLVGRTIAQYEILARIGGGAMGVVYQARDAKLGRRVALKFLPQQWSHDEAAKQRFIREAQAASATEHPNICTIHDIETADDGQLFIVMAFYDGPTLKQRLESGPMPVEEALEIATQIADGLAKAHIQGVVHRDIKPGNIMVTEDGARILDFGLATFVDALKLTAENTSFGTPAYMSPEQVRGQAADARSDVWATGVVLYEMLAGHPPFQGSHAEAIAHAIRHEAPVPLRASRPDVPEEIEQLVFRALHKDPAVRFESGRELARALRRVRGLTVPIELRSEQITVPLRRSPARARRTWRVAAGITFVVVAGLMVWLSRPPDRLPVAIIPAVNITGYADLDPLRLALSHALTSALVDSKTVRVIGHEQLLSVIRRFRTQGKDLASGEVLQAVRNHTGVPVLVVMSLVNDGGGFKARLEFKEAGGLSPSQTYETAGEVSTIVREAAYQLLRPAAEAIEEFGARRSRRAQVAGVVRAALGTAFVPRFPARTLDAFARFEQGLDAYEELEYVAARRAFEAAATADPLNPLPLAWESRVARIMRQEIDAERLGRQAVNLITEQMPESERLFVMAVAAESRRDETAALHGYTALKDRHSDDAMPLLELAAFHDRSADNEDAIAAYHQVLAVDSRVMRPHLELCRLYNRVNQPAEARKHGRLAVDGYTALGSDGARAQSLMCLSDALRVGGDRDRPEALSYATEALSILEQLRYGYNVARAHNYVALALEYDGRLEEAVRSWEAALAAATSSGNLVIEPLVRMNLGATHANLGNRAIAIDYLRQSASRFEAVGDRARAAESRFNIGAMLLQYGGDPQEGRRLVQDALEVFRQLKNRNFEVLAAHVMSTHYRYAGRHKDADQELNRALNLARERDLDSRSLNTFIRLGQARLDAGEYEEARRVLEEPRQNATVRNRLEAQLYLARTYVRLGDAARASALLDEAGKALETVIDRRLSLVFHAARGEWAYDRGRLGEALAEFRLASAFLTADFPDIDALESRAWTAFLQGRDGNPALGEAAIRATLDVARRAGYLSLEARCQAMLAELMLQAGRVNEVHRLLDAVPADDGTRAIDRELRARLHGLRAQAYRKTGNDQKAIAEDAAARSTLEALVTRLDDPHRATFWSRPAFGTVRP